MHPFPGHTVSLIYYGLIALTILLSLLYIGRGYRNALLLPDGSRDLLKRHQEQQYVISGINPNHVYETLRGYPGAAKIEVTIPMSVGGGGYPPWAYFTALFLVPAVDWPVVKIYFAILNALALGIMAWFAYSVMLRYGQLPALAMATSVSAMGANCFALSNGQYGLLVNVFLIAMVVCIKTERYATAGAFYGLALLKPSIAAPFFLILLIRGCWVSILVTAVYVGIASAFVWILVGTDPVTMLAQMLDVRRAGGYTMVNRLWPITLSEIVDVSKKTLLFSTALLGLSGAAVALWLLRKADLTVSLGAAAVFSCLWTAHRAYDDMIMIFLMIAVGALTLQELRSRNVIMFALVALSVWIPGRISDLEYIGYIKLIVWTCALGHLLVTHVKFYSVIPQSRPRIGPPLRYARSRP